MFEVLNQDIISRYTSFVEVEGCILLRAHYQHNNFLEWKEKCDSDITQIESIMNHVHLYDVVQDIEVKLSLKKYEVAAAELLWAWKHALESQFPDRSFNFEYETEPRAYGPTIWFYQKQA
jgi:hypothetical protein